MFAPTPTVCHERARVAGLDEDAGDGVGAVRGVEDADPEVDQLELLELRVDRQERLAQRVVEGVDRAVALPHRDEPARRRPRASPSPR